MTDPEKMEALKRAYAEMILNTAREAAARIMASELRSRRLEHELVSSKEESSRMLNRLKHTIDSKATEADVTLLNQQRKVDELESQLNEAEGIILDLRAELNQAQEQLDGANNKNTHPLRQNENLQVHKKEHDLFRIGCTQRIRATETLLARENWALGDKSDLLENSTNTNNMNAVGKTDDDSVVRKSLRKRKLKYYDDFVIDASGSPHSHKSKNPRQGISYLSCCKTNKVKNKGESVDHLKIEDETQSQKIRDSFQEFSSKELGHTENLQTDREVKNDTATATEASSLRRGIKGFKYTFTRKRKKVSVIYQKTSSAMGKSSLIRNISKGKQNANSGIQRLNLSTKSSKDSKGLVQIAHQLISLSGRGDSTSCSC